MKDALLFCFFHKIFEFKNKYFFLRFPIYKIYKREIWKKSIFIVFFVCENIN
jgi:hypothetical protein